MTAQGAVYTAFIADQEAKEFVRRDRLDAWAANAVTTSTGLLTLSVGLVVLIREEDSGLVIASSAWLRLAFLFLLTSGALALFARHNFKYNATEVYTLSQMVNEHWKDDEVSASNRCARLQIATIESLRKINKTKGRLLMSSFASQVLGVAIVGIALAAAISA